MAIVADIQHPSRNVQPRVEAVAPHIFAPQCRLSAEAARGRGRAKLCAGCHVMDFREPAGPLPNLHDVYTSRAGTQSLKYYMPLVAARNVGLVWTAENLDGYLRAPDRFLEAKTGLVFPQWQYMPIRIAGDAPNSVQARREIIAYLREVKGRPCD